MAALQAREPMVDYPSAVQPNDLELAFDFVGVGLCLTRDRVIQRCNHAFADMFGFAVDALTGQSLALLYPSQREFEDTGAQKLPLMQEEGGFSDERIMRRKEGSLFWCHVIGRALDRVKPFTCAVWAFEDISVRRSVTTSLTAREREVAQALFEGKSAKEIAKQLAISYRTVEAHRARLVQKYNVKNTAGLISKLSGLTPKALC
jgi:PAS domain S-box-containing protein